VFFLVAVQMPGYFSAAWLVEKWGRKPTLVTYLGASAVATFLWAMAEESAVLIFIAAALMSFFTLGAFAVLYTYTPETYPTTLRTTGMGSASGWARVGGFIAPYTGGLLIDVSLVLALSVFAAGLRHQRGRHRRLRPRDEGPGSRRHAHHPEEERRLTAAAARRPQAVGG
jgi:putative MFS transporter